MPWVNTVSSADSIVGERNCRWIGRDDFLVYALEHSFFVYALEHSAFPLAAAVRPA